MDERKNNSDCHTLKQSNESQTHADINNVRYISDKMNRNKSFSTSLLKALDDLIEEKETRNGMFRDTYSPSEERFSALLKEAVRRNICDLPIDLFGDDADFDFDILPTDEEMKAMLSPEEYERFMSITVDYSFLKQPRPHLHSVPTLKTVPEPDLQPTSQPELQPQPNPQREKKVPRFRFPRAAAVFVCFAVAVLGTSVWLNSDAAMATKQRLIGFVGNFSSDGEFESEITDRIYSMDDLDVMLKIVPDLCIPTYIPDGYILSVLETEKTTDNFYYSTFSYENEERMFFIHVQKTPEKGVVSSNRSNGKLVELPDRTLLIWDNPNTNKYGVSTASGQFLVLITGELPEEEMILVAEGLQF